jgi:hypothetical protein
MKILKVVGYAGVASFALAIAANSLILAETPQLESASAEKSNNMVHRVSHTLATAQQYTGGTASGYKWGQENQSKTSEVTWDGSKATASGYKWGTSRTAASTTELAPSSYAEQTRNPWGRKDFSEQARNPWGRKDFSEQARNPWGRKDFSEQTRNPWGRK